MEYGGTWWAGIVHDEYWTTTYDVNQHDRLLMMASLAAEDVQAPAPLMPEGHVDMIPEDPLDLLEPPGTYWDMRAPQFQGASDEVPDEPDPERDQNAPVDQGDQNVLVDGKPTRRTNTKTSLRS
eukprot:3439035-Amphidinium_carterae.1